MKTIIGVAIGFILYCILNLSYAETTFTYDQRSSIDAETGEIEHQNCQTVCTNGMCSTHCM